MVQGELWRACRLAKDRVALSAAHLASLPIVASYREERRYSVPDGFAALQPDRQAIAVRTCSR